VSTASPLIVKIDNGAIGSTCGDPFPEDKEVTDSDPSHYFGIAPAIDIEKATDGYDADTPTGPTLVADTDVRWTYVVANTGDVDLTGVAVEDDQLGAVACPQNELAVGESMTCRADGTVGEGQYANVGTVTGTAPGGMTVGDTDPSHYFGASPTIDIEKATNGYDADTAPGPYVPVGDPVEWTYVVTNTGVFSLRSITVYDSDLGGISCPATNLDLGESMTCTAAGVATADQYENQAVVWATGPRGVDATDTTSRSGIRWSGPLWSPTPATCH